MAALDILYVDDDDDIRHIVELSLALDGDVSVRVAASGPAALALLAEGPMPDVALLDVMMPGMDGPALFAAMRADRRLAAIPVIFVTARGRRDDIANYRAQGTIGVILKPFDAIRLTAEVRALLAAHDRTAAAGAAPITPSA